MIEENDIEDKLIENSFKEFLAVKKKKNLRNGIENDFIFSFGIYDHLITFFLKN